MTLPGHRTTIGYSTSFLCSEKKCVPSYFSYSESHLFYFYVALTATNQIIWSFQKETSLTIECSAIYDYCKTSEYIKLCIVDIF